MNKEIQNLRAIAIVYVIFVHVIAVIPSTWIPTYNKINMFFHTNMGVELFFVIAGYFLSNSLLRINKTNNKTADFINFILKKFNRLYKQAYFWATITVIMAVAFSSTGLWFDKIYMLQKYIATLSWMSNFEHARQNTVFGYYWALSLEFQTFIIYSLIYVFTSRKIATLVAFIICIIMLFYRPGGNDNWWFRFDPILYGAVLHYVINDMLKDTSLIRKAPKHFKACAWIILTICLAGPWGYMANFPNQISQTGAIISVIMVFLAVCQTGWFKFNIPILESVTNYIGERSYSLFCCHVPSWFIIKTALANANISPSILFLIEMVAMFAFSELTYRLFERKALISATK